MATLTGTSGNDTLTGTDGNDLIVPGGGAVALPDRWFSNLVIASGGNDTINGSAAQLDIVSYEARPGRVSVNLSTGTATKFAASSLDSSKGDIAGVDTLIGIRAVAGSDFNDTLIGVSDEGGVLRGGKGDDVIDSNGGYNTLDYSQATGAVTVDLVKGRATGADGNDTLIGSFSVLGSDFADTIIGSGPGEVIVGGKGNDDLRGNQREGFISSVGYMTATGSVTVDLAAGTSSGADGNDRLSGFSGIIGSAFGDVLKGGTGNNYLFGDSGNDTLYGRAGDDYLNGGDGNDWLDGGTGADDMVGGAGNDTYIVDNSADAVRENANEGTDTVRASITYSLAEIANIENLTLTGTAAINGTGNELNNVITGNSGNNILDGGVGADTLNGGAGVDVLVGGTGNDTYIVDTTTDTITENANEGTDTVQTSITYSLAQIANVENLTLTGTAAINGTGNSLANLLTGNTGNNILDGGAGADTLNGGAGVDALAGGTGNDTYIVDTTTDTISENAGEGVDTVQSSVSYTLGDNLENLTLAGTAALNGTGNSLNNLLTGNAANNILNGGAGADTLNGLAGNDRFVGGAGNDVMDGGAGIDTVDYSGNPGSTNGSFPYSGIALSLSDDRTLDGVFYPGHTAIDGFGNIDTLVNIENVIGTNYDDLIGGSEVNNTLSGLDGFDIFAGGAGNDLVDGGNGTDWSVYQGSYSDYQISWNTGRTTLTVRDKSTARTGIDHDGTDTLKNVEVLQFLGNHQIVGVAANNTLAGTSTNEIFTGGTGSDLFIFRSGDGQDTVSNFNAASGTAHDQLGVNRSDFANWNALITKTTRVGNDLVIKANANDTLTLKNVTLSNFTSDDVIFFA